LRAADRFAACIVTRGSRTVSLIESGFRCPGRARPIHSGAGPWIGNPPASPGRRTGSCGPGPLLWQTFRAF